MWLQQNLSNICGHNEICSNRTDAGHVGSFVGKKMVLKVSPKVFSSFVYLSAEWNL